MTIELFRADPYRREFQAQVVRSEAKEIVLDQTCFYGPDRYIPSDLGRIGASQVVGLRRSSEGDLLHLLAEDDPSPTVGTGQFRCKIDWSRRIRVMRLHTAQHLIELALWDTHQIVATRCEQITLDHAGVTVVGLQEALDLTVLGSWLEAITRNDLRMTTTEASTPPFGQVWHLDGVGHRYCDAIHLCSTAEVGQVHLTSQALDPDRTRITACLDG